MKRYEAFMEGKDATNLADAIEENFQQMEKLESSYQDAEVKMDKALSGITSTFHKLGIVKYDAFKEMGGNLSFACFGFKIAFTNFSVSLTLNFLSTIAFAVST